MYCLCTGISCVMSIIRTESHVFIVLWLCKVSMFGWLWVNWELKISIPQSTISIVNKENTIKVIVPFVSNRPRSKWKHKHISLCHCHCYCWLSPQTCVTPNTIKKAGNKDKYNSHLPAVTVIQNLDWHTDMWVDSYMEVLGDIMYKSMCYPQIT